MLYEVITVEDLRPVFSQRMILVAWIPCLLITVLHYRTLAEYAWAHDVLRRLYYLPILFAAFSVITSYSIHYTKLYEMDPRRCNRSIALLTPLRTAARVGRRAENRMTTVASGLLRK